MSSIIPFDKIVKFGQQTMLDSDLFSVSWILGRFCNYKCSYCWPYARTDTLDHYPLSVYKNTIDNIKYQARKNGFNRFHWSFSGGEPTAYKNFLELTRYLDDGTATPYTSIHMTTNLSPGLKWWKQWADAADMLARKSITASYHAEFSKEKDFIEKCLQLMNARVFVTVNQVMVPEKFWETYERCKRIASCGINVTLKPQSNETASAIVDGYTPEMIETMRTGFPQHVHGFELYQIRLTDSNGHQHFLDQAERFNAFGFNEFAGWKCNAGYQSVIIRGNEVKRSYSCHDVLLGTLDNFELFKEPQRCITPSCVSSADSKIPKCK